MHFPYYIRLSYFLSPHHPERFGQRAAKGGGVECFPPHVDVDCALEEEQSPVPQPMDLDHLVQVDFLGFFQRCKATIITQILKMFWKETTQPLKTNSNWAPFKNGWEMILSFWDTTYLQGLWLLVLRRSYIFGWKNDRAVKSKLKSTATPQQEKTDPLVMGKKHHQPLNFDPWSVMPLMVALHLFEMFFSSMIQLLWAGESSRHTRRPRTNLGFKGCWCFLHIGFL